ncbi:FecR domain-containing protein [Zoogloea sp. LCSB751]|uniref:FecR domain-containing protein n=1 Tax=Zoogloea sp. LCSB751 TaxID=1965277 RepID=UPI0009A4F85F|nr:FecR domain-containing protein [Zoogloea sp. LCSB751]
MEPSFPAQRNFSLRPRQLGLAVALAIMALEADACEQKAGTLTALEGRVEVRSSAGGNWQTATPRQTLCPGDQLAVRGPGRAAVVLSQNVLVRLDQNTTLTLPPAADNGELSLSQGIVHVISRFSKRFGVITPFVNALVDGTEFTVASHEQEAQVVVAEGRVRTGNAAGERVLGPGEAIEAHAGSAPGTISVRPLDAVAWAIHYPQVARLGANELARQPEALRRTLETAQREADRGHFLAALDTLGSAPVSDPAVAALKAGILLGLGRVDEATALLTSRAGERHPSLAAIESIVHVARNENTLAEAAAQRAMDLDEASVAAHLALSYTLQATRHLPEALNVAERATLLAPNDAVAWARRAELELSLGHGAAGGEAARRVLALDPDTRRARALAAFARLLHGETEAARTDFVTALEADDSDPLTHFGLGLALMRLGDTEGGRREVEIAALLDPSNAELRSYLGRAYLEEARNKVAGAQFDLARRLDPASPTPWYFDAFLKLLEREPLAAIRNGEEALLRNDNRNVLRSSELLDQDRAARTANLGAAYQQVGFAAAAQATAMNAIEDDVQSAAAHRLLADAYAETPRFETARLGELLQAQLRQPIGQWPLPPQFVMPPLPILDGPRAASPEEATAFFDRKPDRFAATLAGGSRDTQSGSVVASHSWERGQISLGAFDYRGRGLNERMADTHLSGGRINAQLALTPDTMLLGEIRHTERNSGDIDKSLFDGPIGTDHRIINDLQRIGLRHAFGNGEEFIAEVNTQRIRESALELFQSEGLDNNFDATLGQRSKGMSALYSLQRERGSIAVGASAFRLSGTQNINLSFASSADPSMVLGTYTLPTTKLRGDRDTVFSYGQWRLHPTVTLHGGAEYIRLSELDNTQSERLNGKLGIVARLASGTNVRAAFIQGVSGSKYDRESLAPTQFAGFNQAFDDTNGTRWRRAAFGIEQSFGGGINTGVEVSARHMDVPMPGLSSTLDLEPWKEQLHRAHITLPFGQRVAFSLEWRHEEIKAREDTALRDSFNPYKVRTDLLPARLWIKTGPTDTLIEHWTVDQHAARLSSTAGETAASSKFSVTNLRFSIPVASNRLTVSLGIYNIFDRQFRFQNTDLNGDPKIPLFYPQRTALLQGSLRF